MSIRFSNNHSKKTSKLVFHSSVEVAFNLFKIHLNHSIQLKFSHESNVKSKSVSNHSIKVSKSDQFSNRISSIQGLSIDSKTSTSGLIGVDSMLSMLLGISAIK